MTEAAKDTPLYWTDVYLKGQEEFLRRWSQMASDGAKAAAGAANGAAASAASAGSASGGNANPFAIPGFGAGTPDWASIFMPQFSGASADVAKKYFALYEQYLGAGRGLWDLLTRSMTNPDPAARAQVFLDGLKNLQQPFTQMWSGAGFGNVPSFGNMPSFANMPAFGSMPGFANFPGASDMPALGLTRERQESLQRLQHLSTEFMQHQGTLVAMWGEVIAEGLKTLGERVAEKFKNGEAITSVKDLYDLWVEGAELAYAKAAHTPEYAKAQADLGNTLALLRIEQRKSVEVLTKQLDLPTRDELNAVHHRLKQMKKEIRALEEKLAASAKAGTTTSAAPAAKGKKAS
jgi:class III poly(R)-hydroxyalkanoic acid synthase PhaE subunit